MGVLAAGLVACGSGSENERTEATEGGSGGTTGEEERPGDEAASMETSAGSGGGHSASSAGDTGGSEGEDGPGVDVQCAGVGGSEPDDGVICFYDVDTMDVEPAASVEYELVELEGQAAIYVRLVFAPWFADNTYGENQIGWPKKHTFDELVGSDHAHLVMSNSSGEVVLDFELDYIDEDPSAPSGYRCLGVWDGNGKMNEGDPSAILAANSSLSRNLNERGHSANLEDSPATDENYTPNPGTLDWDYRIVYEVWVDATLFSEGGDTPFSETCVQSIHASPAKSDEHTKDVVPELCPPGWDCFREDGCTQCDPSEVTDPDSSTDPCDPTAGLPPVP